MNQSVHKVTYILDRQSLKKGEPVVLQKTEDLNLSIDPDLYGFLFQLFDFEIENNGEVKSITQWNA